MLFCQVEDRQFLHCGPVSWFPRGLRLSCCHVCYVLSYVVEKVKARSGMRGPEVGIVILLKVLWHVLENSSHSVLSENIVEQVVESVSSKDLVEYVLWEKV